ncbi:hypothetical protein JW916_14210 [Candidatus Sumerlaeota bacterium]|nr:hypothetical protein [Candidatus Sumerlaeota bacterium]
MTPSSTRPDSSACPTKTRFRADGLEPLRRGRPPRAPLDGNPDEVDAILLSDVGSTARIETVPGLEDDRIYGYQPDADEEETLPAQEDSSSMNT